MTENIYSALQTKLASVYPLTQNSWSELWRAYWADATRGNNGGVPLTGDALLAHLAANGGGTGGLTARLLAFAAAIDYTGPVLSVISAGSPGTTTATITWTSDEAATSKVDYGPTASYGSSTTLDATLVTSHSVGLSGLTDNATYHYRVRSKDAQGNETVSDDGTFATIAAAAVHDTFTAANGTPIAGRTASPVAGTSTWTESKFASTIIGNKFSSHNVGGEDTETWINSGLANCTITCKIARSAGGYGGLMYRAIGTAGNQEYFYLANATDWALGVAGSGGSGTHASGNGTFTAGVEYELKVVLLGTNIKAYIDGALKADVTSGSSYTTNTKHGVLGLQGTTFDDFKVVA